MKYSELMKQVAKDRRASMMRQHRLVHVDDSGIQWITTQTGAHIPLVDGKAVGGAGGALKGKDFSYAKSEPTPSIGGDDEAGISSPKKLVEHRMAKAGYSAELESIRKLFGHHTSGGDYQKSADEQIAQHIANDDEIGKALKYKADLEEKHLELEQEEKYASDVEKYQRDLEWAREQLKPGGIYTNYSNLSDEDLIDYGILPEKPEKKEPRFYRKGGMNKDVLSFTTNKNGAGMSFLTEGEEGYIGYDVSYTLSQMKEMGFRPIAGIQSMDVGMSGESEVLFAKFP